MEVDPAPNKPEVKDHKCLTPELQQFEESNLVNNTLKTDETFQKLKKFISSSASLIEITKPKVSLTSVVGLTEIKKDLLEYLDKSVLGSSGAGDFKYNDRILFFGDNFTGKTFLTEAIATELDANLINFGFHCIYQFDLKLDQVIKALYEICKEKGSKTTILFLRYLESFGEGPNIRRCSKNLIETVQKTWKNFDTSGSSRLIIIATTHKPNRLNEILTSCFDKRIYTPTLSFKERKELFEVKIEDKWEWGHAMTKIELDWLAMKTLQILTSEIGNIVDDATRVQYWNWRNNAAKVPKEGQQGFENFKRRPLKVEDFMDVIRSRGFMVMEKTSLGHYEAFQKKFGNGPYMELYQREANDMEKKSDEKPGVDEGNKTEKKKNGLLWSAFSLI